MDNLYPWGGEFTTNHLTSPVAVVILNCSYTPPSTVSIHGYLKTENIGIEKIIANVISNPFIRFIVVCGEEIRGHRSGQSLISLHQNGIDENNRIIGAKGAIPYIENLEKDAVHRFQQQVDMIDLIDTTDENIIQQEIDMLLSRNPGSYGQPFIAIRLVSQTQNTLDDTRALHGRIIIDYMGRVKKRE